MDITSSLRRYLNLKNNIIPATHQKIQELGGDIFSAEVTLRGIKDEKVFLEDFKWDIRTRGFTIFNLIHLPSLIAFTIFLIVVLLALSGIAIIGVIVETIIRTFILFQDFEFEDTFLYIPIKAVEDFIYYPPSIPITIVVGLLTVWVLYSIRQVRKNKIYYENVVIPENRKKNALVPGKRRKQQIVVDNLKNTRQATESQLLNYQAELQNIMNAITIPKQYWSNDEAVSFLINKFEYGQAKTLGEALTLWERELQTRRNEQAARDIIREKRKPRDVLLDNVPNNTHKNNAILETTQKLKIR